MNRSDFARGSFFRTIILLGVIVAAQQPSLIGQAAPAKLSTVLRDLTRVVPQDPGAVSPFDRADPIDVSRLPASVQDAAQSRRLRFGAGNTVQVYLLVSEVTPTVLARLRAADVVVEIANATERRIQARVPVRSLSRIASMPFVTFVRLPAYAVRHAGAVVSEGDAIHNASVARPQFGVDGTGVRVGVISDGINGLFAARCTTCRGLNGGPIGSGDIPDGTATRRDGVLTEVTGDLTAQSYRSDDDLEDRHSFFRPCSFRGAGAEGGALLEIVHDLAPGAQLSFANADTSLSFIEAVNALAASNDVVVDDLGFLGEPADGQSSVSRNTAAALNNANNRIRTYVTSVGNAANDHYFGALRGLRRRRPIGERHQLAGPVAPLPGDQRDEGRARSRQSATRSDFAAEQRRGRDRADLERCRRPVRQQLRPLSGRRRYRGRWWRAAPTSSAAAQDAFEAIDFLNRGDSGMFRIVIQNVNDEAAPRNLNMFSFQPQCAVDGPRRLATGRHERHNYNTPSRSVLAQSDSGGSPVSAISVGAICSASAAAMATFAASDAPSAVVSRPESHDDSVLQQPGPDTGRTVEAGHLGDRWRRDHRRRTISESVLRHVGRGTSRRWHRRARPRCRAMPAQRRIRRNGGRAHDASQHAADDRGSARRVGAKHDLRVRPRQCTPRGADGARALSGRTGRSVTQDRLEAGPGGRAGCESSNLTFNANFELRKQAYSDQFEVRSLKFGPRLRAAWKNGRRPC